MMPSVIAMSLPAVGKEATYRNPIDDVARFFATYHHNQFLIFNLCSVLTVPVKLYWYKRTITDAEGAL